jgi:K+-transporting ATPase c subunit
MREGARQSWRDQQTNKALHSAAEQPTAEPFAAEPVEPRAETKRNAGQQSTCGTQDQVSVSQALERIRRVAKERKKEKFTSLLHQSTRRCGAVHVHAGQCRPGARLSRRAGFSEILGHRR